MSLDEPLLLTHLPEHVFYRILCFVNHPHHASVVIARQITPLCAATRQYTSNDSLWENVFKGYNPRSSESDYRARTQRWTSKRLRRTTAKEDCIDAHIHVRKKTEMCLIDVTAMAICKNPHPLSLTRLRRVLTEYGPILNIDQRWGVGGTLLVDCCKAVGVRETTILECVRELIEKYGASPDNPANEVWYVSPRGVSTPIKEGKKHQGTLPPLVVASARGMPKVVEYLVKTDPSLIRTSGSGCFHLEKTDPEEYFSGTYTPLEFAKRMRHAEHEHGATRNKLKSLDQCIRILTDTTTATDLTIKNQAHIPQPESPEQPMMQPGPTRMASYTENNHRESGIPPSSNSLSLSPGDKRKYSSTTDDVHLHLASTSTEVNMSDERKISSKDKSAHNQKREEKVGHIIVANESGRDEGIHYGPSCAITCDSSLMDALKKATVHPKRKNTADVRIYKVLTKSGIRVPYTKKQAKERTIGELLDMLEIMKGEPLHVLSTWRAECTDCGTISD